MIARCLVAFAAAMIAGPAVQSVPFEAIVLPVPLPPGPAVQPYVKVAAGQVALVHVRVIDGTGAPPRNDMTVIEVIAADVLSIALR